jgi:hypothetical protein
MSFDFKFKTINDLFLFSIFWQIWNLHIRVNIFHDIDHFIAKIINFNNSVSDIFIFEFLDQIFKNKTFWTAFWVIIIFDIVILRPVARHIKNMENLFWGIFGPGFIKTSSHSSCHIFRRIIFLILGKSFTCCLDRAYKLFNILNIWSEMLDFEPWFTFMISIANKANFDSEQPITAFNRFINNLL